MKKMILQYLGIGVGAAVGVATSTFVTSYMRDSSAKKDIEEQNKLLPRKVDEVTTLMKMSFDDNRLEYIYEIDARVPAERLKANLPTNIQLAACKVAETKKLSDQVDLRYSYFYPDKTKVLSLDLPKGYCK